MVFCRSRVINSVVGIAAALAGCIVSSSATTKLTTQTSGAKGKTTAKATTSAKASTAAKYGTSKATAGTATTKSGSSKAGAHLTTHQVYASGHSYGYKGRAARTVPVKGPTLPPAPSPERYQEIQKALAARGFYKGEVNGTWGPDSVDALKQFQTAHGLLDDGKISSLSLIGLGLGPSHAYPGGIIPTNGLPGDSVPAGIPPGAPKPGDPNGQLPQAQAAPIPVVRTPAPETTPPPQPNQP